MTSILIVFLQVIQSTGRGVRRDTHKGLERSQQAMREVKTHIYFAVLGTSIYERQKEQIIESDESVKEIMAEWQEQQKELFEARTRFDVLSRLECSKEIKAELKEVGKRILSLQKSVPSLVQLLQDTKMDIEMLKSGMVFISTGKISKKTGAEKRKLVPIWDVLPDQAVYNATWADEQAKQQVEDVLKGMSVHAQLLENFHQNIPALGPKLSKVDLQLRVWSSSWCSQSGSENIIAKAFEAHSSIDSEPPTLLSIMKIQKNLASSTVENQDDNSKAQIQIERRVMEDFDDKQDSFNCVACFQDSAVGIKCAKGQFVCSGCVSMLISVEMEDLERLGKHLGAFLCPKSSDGCPPIHPDYLECTLRRVAPAVYEEYRDFQRKAHKMKEILALAAGSSHELPQHWSPLGVDKYAVRLVSVAHDSSEYSAVALRFKKTCRQHSIVSIERLQNFEQWSLYREKRRAMEQKNMAEGANERQLFHGTHPTAVPLINHKSFNRSYCGRNATAYGRGIYFARDASYSASDIYSPPNEQGIQHMYLVNVLAGLTIEGNDEMIEPPPLPDGQGVFDSTCGLLFGDKLGDPSITVVYHDAQAYAEYLIRFRG